jgi:multiple sugar transport system substrate-binding protein
LWYDNFIVTGYDKIIKEYFMKKFLLTIGILLSVMTFALAGGRSQSGGGSQSQSETIELVFATFHSNQEGEFMQKLADDYSTANPGVKIKVEFSPQAEYFNGAVLTSSFAAGTGPDIYLMSPGNFLKYVSAGVALDLTQYYTPSMLNDFMKSSIDAVTVNGKIYAVPIEIELLGLYYDADILAQEGVAVPKTWDEFVTATKKLTTSSRPGLVIPTDQDVYQNFVWYPFLWQTGADVLDPAARKGTFNTPKAASALKLWGDLIKAGAASKLTVHPTETFYMNGFTPMQINGTWAVSNIEREYPNKNIRLAPLPVPSGGKAATCAGGWKFMVNSKSKYAAEAAKFVMWAWAENVQKPLEWCTVTKFAYSPRKSVVEAGQAIYSKGLRKVFTDEIYSTAIPEPRYEAPVIDAAGQAIQEVMFGGADPQTAANNANIKIDAYLKTYTGNL